MPPFNRAVTASGDRDRRCAGGWKDARRPRPRYRGGRARADVAGRDERRQRRRGRWRDASRQAVEELAFGAVVIGRMRRASRYRRSVRFVITCRSRGGMRVGRAQFVEIGDHPRKGAERRPCEHDQQAARDTPPPTASSRCERGPAHRRVDEGHGIRSAEGTGRIPAFPRMMPDGRTAVISSRAAPA